MIKKLSRFLIVITILSLVITSANADTPDPPDPGGGPGGDPVGGGAPIEGGLVISIILAAAYGSRKIAAFNKSE